MVSPVFEAFCNLGVSSQGSRGSSDHARGSRTLAPAIPLPLLPTTPFPTCSDFSLGQACAFCPLHASPVDVPGALPVLPGLRQHRAVLEEAVGSFCFSVLPGLTHEQRWQVLGGSA